jgi:hypothetical protein
MGTESERSFAGAARAKHSGVIAKAHVIKEEAQVRKKKVEESEETVTAVDVATEINSLAEIGGKLNARQLKNAALGKLAKNMVTGVDHGNEAAHLIGKTKDVGLFETESKNGIIIIQAPEGVKKLIEALDKPALEYLPAE